MIAIAPFQTKVLSWHDVRAAAGALAVADRYTEMLDAIIDQRGSNGGWPPRTVNQVAGWMVVRIAAMTFHKSVAEVARDLIHRWEGMRR